ncbi:uncharacterized protein ATC70_006489 [Mucor velutinosus]|uniref:C2H2-type domain-containing protein n=1 Tax=Mucor velutinosus TaxID=708070 RepID=A0AAN7I436_9FUNG|nr:hypothetical protein ATC70_006489 [Mucor velutinosus]
MFNMSTADLQNHNERFNQSMLPAVAASASSSFMREEDDSYNQDNKSETSSRGGNAKSKMFQCTGYGECRMVFTRSEHLARHMRKHTGEKPFQCVVPGCERMFSRFDNMMQHTQTHNKTRGPRRTKTTSTKSKRGGKKSGNNLSRRASSSSSDYDEYGPLPSPPPSRRGSSNNIIKENQIILPNPKYLEVDEDMDELMTSEDDDDDYEFYQNDTKTITSTSRFPDSPASSSDSSLRNNSTTTSKLSRRRRSAPQVRYQPYPYNNACSEKQSNRPRESIPRRNSALSELATYLVDHPGQSPESYLTKFHSQEMQLKHQQQQPLPPRLPTRRLSIQDLSNPIETLDDDSKQHNKPECKHPQQEPEQHRQDGVDLTEDEFQAIQGFGQFYKSAITCNK